MNEWFIAKGPAQAWAKLQEWNLKKEVEHRGRILRDAAAAEKAAHAKLQRARFKLGEHRKKHGL